MVAEATSLISYEEALAVALRNAPAQASETLDLSRALNRVLAQDIRSRTDLPAFDNSAVDGYAVCEADIERGIVGRCLRLAGESRAGRGFPGRLEAGNTVRIFTGAPMPSGAAAVVMQEDAEVDEAGVKLFGTVRVGDNIRRRGEELQRGDLVVPAAHVLDPASIGAIAAAGHGQVAVYRLPKIAILVTGDELASPGSPLGESAIYESNGQALSAAVSEMGLEVSDVERCNDDIDLLAAMIERLLVSCDILLTTGGVSVGGHDLVKPALKRLGAKELFAGVAIKPGKPVCLYELEGKFVFGLPGNPVSALVTCFLLAKPFLAKMAGHQARTCCKQATLSETLTKKAGRAEFVPCHLEGNSAHPYVGRASHKTSSLATANGFVVLSELTETAAAGTTVDVLDFDWRLSR